jgi:hypothetical protein
MAWKARPRVCYGLAGASITKKVCRSGSMKSTYAVYTIRMHPVHRSAARMTTAQRLDASMRATFFIGAYDVVAPRCCVKKLA